MKIAFLTLGCKVNYYETEKMSRDFSEHGYEVVGFDETADIYVINTCTVTNIADRKSRQMIRRARAKAPDALIVAIGCYVESLGERKTCDSSFEDIADLMLSNRDKADIVIITEEALGLTQTKTACEDPDRMPVFRDSRTRAFLKIQDGCNQFCSYCLIPYVRGRGQLSSTPADEVIREVRERVEAGFSEFVLNGIHLSSYGTTDFVRDKGKPLADLIHRVGDVPGVERIRLGSLEPRIITGEWIADIAREEKLCPHFHLSLQSGCDATLRRMNRHYTTEEYHECTERIREVFDRPAITTDVIVGFPGETEEEYETTVSFLEKIGFADMHVFQYSVRNGTRAAKMPDQVSPSVKKDRSERLLEKVRTWKGAYIRRFEGESQKILFEEEAKYKGVTYMTGFNERYVRYGVTRQKHPDAVSGRILEVADAVPIM